MHDIFRNPNKVWFRTGLLGILFGAVVVNSYAQAPIAGSPFTVGTGPVAVAVADFNGDGLPDYAVVNGGSNNVTILLNNFTSPGTSPISVGNGPNGIVAADFTGDGKRDLVVTNATDSTFTLLTGDGTGNFTAGTPVSLAAAPGGIVTGDFNGDGSPDLAISEANGTVVVLFNNGAGTFVAAPSPFTVGSSPKGLATGRFHAVGVTDIVVVNAGDGTINALLGDGHGNFAVAAAVQTGGTLPTAVAVADYDGDGNLDLATSNSGSSNVSILLGNGIGGFAAAASSPIAVTAPIALVATDFNGDGLKDLIVSNFAGPGTLTILINTGGATFSAIPVNVGNFPNGLAVADVNDDHQPDIAVVNQGDGNLTVLLNNLPSLQVIPSSVNFFTGLNGQASPAGINVATGEIGATPPAGNYTVTSTQAAITPNPNSGTAATPSPFTLSLSNTSLPSGITTGVVRMNASGYFGATLPTKINALNASGTLAAAATPTVTVGNTPVATKLVDVNGDGKLDLLALNQTDATISVFIGDGSGNFTAATGSPFSTGTTPTSFAVADFNNDGFQDIVVSNSGSGNFTLLLGNGTGSFTQAGLSPFAAGNGPTGIVATDFNNDGIQDVAVTNATDNTLSVFLGTGFGGFTPAVSSPISLGAGTTPAGIATADFNGDGNPDLVIANSGAGTATVLLGNGDGGFNVATGSPFTVGTQPLVVIAGDLNGSGSPSFATSNFGSGNVSVWLGNGSGGFTAATGSPFSAGNAPIGLDFADFNGDGVVDLAVANAADNTFSVLLGPVFNAPVTYPAGTNARAISAGDINNDGLIDAVIANGGGNVTVDIGSIAAPTLTLSTTATGTLTAPASIPLTATLATGTPEFNASTGSIVFSDTGTQIGTVALVNGSATLSQTYLTGAHSFTATYAGDLRNSASATAAPLLETVQGASQSITFTQLPNATFGDGPITLGATASSTLPVSYAVTAGNAFVSLSGNILTILGAGSVTIQATQAGNTTFAAATPVNNTFTINPESQTITFAAIPNQTFGNGPFAITPTPTASSTLPVALAITAGSAFATLNNGTVTIIGAGSVTIQATQGGNANFSAAPSVSQTFTINPANQTITFAAIPNQTFGNGPFAITPTPTASSTLPVALAITAGSAFATLNNGTVTITGVGSVTIQATQLGNANYNAAAAVSQTFTISQATQTINFPAIANQTFGNPPVVLNATGGNSGNAVTYGSVTGPATLAGNSLTLTGTGLVSVTASQAGNANYSAATNVTVSFTVNQAGQNITFTPIPNHTFGDPAFQVSATGSNSGIPIVYSISSGPATIAGSTVTITGVGSVTVAANQAGNANYNPGSASFTFLVSQATQTINFPALPNITFGVTANVNLTATGGASGNPVTYGVTGPATLVGSTLTINGAGNVSVTANQAGNANYSAATQVTQSFTVSQGLQVINFTAIPNHIATDAPFAITATGGASGLPVTFSVTSGAGAVSLAGNTVTILSAGNVTITASQGGNANYAAAASVGVSFTISLAPQTITFTAPPTATPNSSFPLTATSTSTLPVTLAVLSGPANLTGNTLNVTGVGAVVVQATQAGNAIYAAATPVTRTISAAPLIPNVNWNPAPLVYGTPLGAAQLDAFSSIPGSFSYAPSAGTILPAGTSVLTVTFVPSTPGYTSATTSVFVVVSQATQTINFPSIAAQVTSAAPFSPGASASSGLPITYSVVSGPATISGGLVTLTGTGSVTIQAAQPGNSNYMPATPVSQTFAVAIGPVSITSVLNAASYTSGPLTAGSFAVVFGSGFSAGGTDKPSISITDSTGALTAVSAYYVSPGQLNILLPNGLAAGSATLTVTNSASQTGTFAVMIAAAAPALFTADSSGKGVAAGYVLIIGQDGSVSSFPFSACGGKPVTCTAIPIPVGSLLLGGPNATAYLILYGTGFSNIPLSGVTATIGGTTVPVVYAGAQGSDAGLDQLNLQLPNSLRGMGLVTIQLTVNGVAANPVTAAF